MVDSLFINLLDIDESGKRFDFKLHADKALDEQLKSVVEDLKDFKVHLDLSRAGDIYIARGNFVLQKGDVCSLCAEDLVLKVDTKFNEYLMVETSKDAGHAPHSGLNYENTQETYFLDSYELDVFSFLREVMTAAISLYPKCEDTVGCEQRQEELKKKMEGVSLKGNPAFAVLEKLKKH